MGMLSRLAGWWRSRSSGTADPEQWLVDYVRGGQASSAGVAVSRLRAMRDVTWLAGVSIRAGDLAKCPVHVYRQAADGGRSIIADHPLERLLRAPNGWQDRLEFIEQMQAKLLDGGNAHAVIERDGRNQPLALIPVEHAELRSTDAGELFYWIAPGNLHQNAVLRGLPNPIRAADVLHLRWLSFDGLSGLSRRSLGRDAIGLSLALEEFSARLFANGARPGGVLETDKKMSDPGFERFKAQWRARYSGLENVGETPILEEGLKWKAQTMTSVEAETIQARRLQIEQIATVLDIPLHRLGIVPDGGGAAMLQAHQMYLNNTLSTDAERWEAKLNQMFGLDGETEFVAFDLDYFNRADAATRMVGHRTAIIGSVLKVNEVRRKEGYADVPGGDVILQPANVVPLGTLPSKADPAGPGSDVTGQPAPGGDGDPTAVPALPA